MKLRTLVFGIVAASASVVGAKELVSIRVTPAVAFAPADLNIRIRVEPDANNRAMAVIADSETYYRSSTVELDGDRAPATTNVRFRSLPPGEYEVTVSVIAAGSEFPVEISEIAGDVSSVSGSCSGSEEGTNSEIVPMT